MAPFGLNFEESTQQLYYQYLEHLHFCRTWYVLKTKTFGYVTNGCNLFKFKHVFYLLSVLLLWLLSSLSLFLWQLLLYGDCYLYFAYFSVYYYNLFSSLLLPLLFLFFCSLFLLLLQLLLIILFLSQFALSPLLFFLFL